MDLFDHATEKERAQNAPLADRMRPKTLEEYAGQKKIVGDESILRKAIERDEVPSMLLWGPPGSGKTTLAKIIANMTQAYFVPFSAVNGSVKQIRQVVKIAQDKRKFNKQKTILFVDEIHRFNKAQQDAFLPYVENGTIILIGATTENPSFEVNAALLSRCRVFVLEPLAAADIEALVKRAIKDEEHGYGSKSITFKQDALAYLAAMANGDARTALNALEFAVQSADDDNITITKNTISESFQKTHILYDRDGEEHYNIISALHKSMRGSDVNASLYWLGRMLEAGEDPLYVARRLVRFASEDIGLADASALPQAVSAYQAAHFIGMPECNVILAQAVAYLAKAPKSNALYKAYKRVQKDIRERPADPVPLHLRNAPTKLMKNLDYGKGYKYTPNYKNPEDAQQDYLPKGLKNRRYFED